MEWALKQNKKVLFIPDRHMGENVASWLAIPPEKIAYWPAGQAAVNFRLEEQKPEVIERFDKAQLILFASECGVHSYYQSEMIAYWQQQGYYVVAHPECRKEVVAAADGYGSTAYLWDTVFNDRAGTGKYAVATENHMVKNLREVCEPKNIQVVNASDIPHQDFKKRGCGCATMSRNDPPHLVAVLDLLRQGKVPEFNQVKPGDVVNEFAGSRERFDTQGQQWVVTYAKRALEKMISITESLSP
jgi:quinolinate synthase